jgi:hypothetical protein
LLAHGAGHAGYGEDCCFCGHGGCSLLCVFWVVGVCLFLWVLGGGRLNVYISLW